MKKIYALTYTIITIAVIFWNYYSSAYGIDGNDVSSISAKYNNLFTPAGYAFAIWGPIFIGLLAHAFYQIKKAFFDTEHSDFILKIGPWFSIANLANGVWIWFWLTDQLAYSVLIMCILLFSLIMIFIRLNMERWDAPFKLIRWVWWPVAFYAGWISVALIANVSAYLTSINFHPFSDDATSAAIMIFVAAALNLFMLIFRSSREFASVGIWALIAIAIAQWNGELLVRNSAMIATGILFVAVSIHAFLNWSTNPLARAMGKGSARDNSN